MSTTQQRNAARSPTPDSLTSYLLLAFVAMAGLAYINFLPGLVSALATGLGFSDSQAGRVVALNGYGGIVGTVLAVFLVRRAPRRRALLLLFAGLALMDATSAAWSGYPTMLGWRFLAGVVGGLCVGLAFAALAQLRNPDRAFGLLLCTQFCVGSLVIYLLPRLEAVWSAAAVFYVMAMFAALSFAFVWCLPRLPDNIAPATTLRYRTGISSNNLLLMLAMLIYQTAASGIWAYVGLVGLSAARSAEAVSTYIAAAGLLGLAGAMLPVLGGKRFGRLYWVLPGIALSASAAAALVASQSTALYLSAMAGLFFAWPAVQSYLLAVSADLDRSGQLAAVAGVVSYAGLASGPLLASSLLQDNDFSIMLYSSAALFLLAGALLIKPVRATVPQPALPAGT
jgi:predicted MFS family arabinose efflux permease